MQIWKSLYVPIFKRQSESIEFPILRVLKLFIREVCIFVKK